MRPRARNPSPLPLLTAAGYRLPSPREPRPEKHRAAIPIRRKQDKRLRAAGGARTFATIRLPAPDKMYAVATR